jgi:hypothetical protein
MRIVGLLALVSALRGAESIDADALYGHWVVDPAAATAAQHDAVATATHVENFGLTLTLRTARIIFARDNLVAGIWRVDEATPTTATLVVQPKGGDERRYHLTLMKGLLVVAECPGQLPLSKGH